MGDRRIAPPSRQPFGVEAGLTRRTVWDRFSFKSQGLVRLKSILPRFRKETALRPFIGGVDSSGPISFARCCAAQQGGEGRGLCAHRGRGGRSVLVCAGVHLALRLASAAWHTGTCSDPGCFQHPGSCTAQWGTGGSRGALGSGEEGLGGKNAKETKLP